jgi:hypothetical protein
MLQGFLLAGGYVVLSIKDAEPGAGVEVVGGDDMAAGNV